MKKLHLLAVVALIMLGLSGCEKAKTVNQAWADAFVKTIKNSQGASVYSVVHTVFAFTGMKSVSVTSPDGTVLQLANYQNGGVSFFNEPVEADYKATPPSAGNYTYTVTFNDGEQIVYTNTLAPDYLLPANITSLAKTTNGDSVYIYWEPIANVDAYGIYVNTGTTQVFKIDGLSDPSEPKKTSLRYGFAVNKLTSSATGIFTFEISGFLIEKVDPDYTYLQAKSTATKNITL